MFACSLGVSLDLLGLFKLVLSVAQKKTVRTNIWVVRRTCARGTSAVGLNWMERKNVSRACQQASLAKRELNIHMVNTTEKDPQNQWDWSCFSQLDSEVWPVVFLLSSRSHIWLCSLHEFCGSGSHKSTPVLTQLWICPFKLNIQ